MGHFLGMNSRVHPKYKTKYRVSNWAEYDRTLVDNQGKCKMVALTVATRKLLCIMNTMLKIINIGRLNEQKQLDFRDSRYFDSL